MKPPSHKRTDFQGRRFAPSCCARQVPHAPCGALMLLLCASPKLFSPSRLGAGVAPLHALFCSLREFSLAREGETEGRGGFTVSLSHFDLKISSSCFAHQVPHAPFSLGSLSASFPLLPRDELCSGAPEGDLPPAPQGERRIRLYLGFGKKKRPTS